MLKDTELKLVSELMRNSRRSDRELARTFRTSQPRITRARTKLEKEGFIKEYTVIPDFCKLGYTLMALTFTSVRPILSQKENQKEREFAKQQRGDCLTHNIIMFERGLGLKHTGIILSLHKTYIDFTLFMQMLRQASASTTHVDENTESFLIDLNDEVCCRRLTFSTLATHCARSILTTKANSGGDTFA